MDCSHYSIGQLKALRGSNLESCFGQKLIEEAKRNQVLAHIMGRRVHHKSGMHSLSRANAEARKSSSAESDSTSFAKSRAPQPVAPPQEHFIRQTMVPSMVEATQLDGQAGRQLDGQDAEPEVQAPEVHSQRTVLPDQKRKGFEQFYEAVRSPTHVRVTAGGRIVPNTLDPAHSPTGKGSKDRLNAESQPQFGQQPPLNGLPFLPGHPMLPMHPAFLMAQPGMAPAMPGAALPPSFGGQWFFPPPPMMPMPFPGNPMLGPLMYQQAPPTPMSAGVIPGVMPGALPVSGAFGAPPPQSATPSYLSSIRPSIITKNQLAGLRSSLKKAEAQLAYNRHQIDERHMEEYARQLRADIQHFEVKLKGELALETPNEHSTEGKSDSSNNGKSGPIDDVKSEPVLFQGKAELAQPAQTIGKEHSKSSEKKIRKKDRVRLTVDTSMPFKPSILASAALAPVFQPRAEAENPAQAKTQRTASMLGDNKKDTFGGRFHGPIPVNFEESSRYLSNAPPTPADDIETFSNFARDNAGLGLPYLIGEVPFGMDPGPDIRDYIYHRALTQDEEMAKHLFWTSAPDHLRGKFPKFDGKDFYPISPEKQPRPSKNRVSRVPTGRPAEDYGFSMPTADLDPFAPLEPYRGDVFRTASVGRERDLKRATKSDNVTSPMKHRSGSKLRPVAYFNSQGLDESKDSSGSSENVGETDSERAYFNSCVRAWSERVTATATALPGAVHTEHIAGFLPRISNGGATLSPAIVKAAAQASRPSPAKATDGSSINSAFERLAISADGRAENQPPNRSILTPTDWNTTSTMSTPTLAEKLDKIRSPGLQSQKRTAVVLEAVDTTLKEQNTEPTPTGYFAALLALLTQAVESGNISSETTTSVVYLLDTITPFAPQPLLRAKFTQILTSLAPVLLQQDAEALLLRSSIGCLESLLLAQDSHAWELGVTQIGPRRAVAGLLNISLDHRPKIRKRAQEALRKVLTNPPPSPSLDHPAADMCAHTALANLEDLATKAAQARKQKSGAESAHDPALIHALQLIKTVASSSGGWPSKKIESLCELLLGISRSGNEYMTMASFEIFEMIFEGMAGEVASAKLPRLMEIISELRPAANDTQLIPPWLAILSRGYDVSAQLEPEDVFQNLPEIFSMVAQFLESPAHNIRVSASECLVSFLANCIPKQVILEPSIYDEKTLDKIAKIAESLLSVKYQQAWMESFNVFGAMFDSLRWRAHPMMLNITKAVGDLRGSDSFQGKKEADEVIGKAVRAMGPEAVLSILPLNLAKPVKGQQGRAWMFPILRDYVSNTELAHFRREMVPLSELMFQRVLDHGKAEKTMEVKIFETLVQQIWATLPGYCDLPLDLTESFDQGFAELLANILYKQVELRLEVCRALKILVESNQAIAAIEDAEEDLVLQSRVSKATAKKNLEHLGSFAGNMLAVLFNVYTQTLPQSRGPILLTINAFLSVTPEKELIETFDRVSKMLAAELQQTAEQEKPKQQQKSQDQMPSTSNTLMDLIITISVYLPRESFSALFEIASVIIFKENEPQLQKKAYKLVPRLAESERGRLALQERSEELQQMFLNSAEKVSAPARRERLGALSSLLSFIPDTSLHFIPSVLSEVVICCKENNERAREAAYDLLVLMGQRMEAANNAPIDNSKVPHMPDDAPAGKANIEEFLTMVIAGLAGSTAHMISASITAVSRVLYEFRRSFTNATLIELVGTMDLFLTSNNREIVKSVLGFVKICVVSLPSELLIPRLSTLVPNLIKWGHEHKGHFKSKVRHILERMVRKFGYELVNQNCPEDDRKLINNIRKTKERSKRKKDAARQAGEESEDEDGHQGRKFDNELDQALYSSDSDGSDDDDEDDEEAGAGARGGKRGNRKGGNAYIVEDEDEPLDLLDRNALANISSTKPVKMRKPTKSRAKTDLDGKLILGKDSDDEMEIDGAAEGSGVNAYVAALKGKDVARKGRGGKLKFSNKRGQDDEDMEDMDEADAHAVKAQVDRSRGNGDRGRGPFRGGRGGPPRGGGRGGRGGIAAGRKGLGEERRRSGPMSGGGVGKGRGGGGGGFGGRRGGGGGGGGRGGRR
ncbi:hypothetical protein CkaCkLH20_03863 [Colletotrichum karsti]|uniref:Ribosomal RNA-processing protein 12 n=1 Tax=Colletotrichum karsti TaxID=1095194 RepID=A0A9P6I828_9PEZI|nr:uncharacterized protein CkaCkLH20_03863 [Colletotrichum karsti]KAF9878963.1 hypothetical protein CkaCkLH20_03863 [Colletotrichum karsti]